MTQTMSYQPLVLIETENLPRDKWLEYRRLGIGGSDVAAILGISPFRTARDLYYDKLNIMASDDEGNWVAMEMGNLLEPLVARIFAKKTGLKIYQRKCMFQHPHYPWMLADLDYLVELPDGTTAILEIKTTNYNARENWWYNGKEIVPVYYESQGRHYMSVMNIDRVYFCCLYGNNEDEVIIRHIDRDMDYEEELIALEQTFWHENILSQNPPPYTEDGDLIMESLRRQLGPSEKDGNFIDDAKEKAINEALENAGFGIQLCDLVQTAGGTRYGSEIPLSKAAAAQNGVRQVQHVQTQAVHSEKDPPVQKKDMPPKPQPIPPHQTVQKPVVAEPVPVMRQPFRFIN